jgi:phosphomevalonate kinase
LGSDLAIIVRLSEPIKQHWAESHALDLSQLLDSTAYKEQHRLAMIKWSEKERAKDYGIFCSKAADSAKGEFSLAFLKILCKLSIDHQR